jgi:hypothetical protein
VTPREFNLQQFDQPDLQKYYSIDKPITGEIYAAYRVHPALVGDTSVTDGDVTDVEKLEQHFERSVVYTLAGGIERFLNSQVLPAFGVDDNIYIEAKKPLLDTIDNHALNKSEQARRIFESSIATRNEARQIVGLDPLPDDAGDVYFFQLTQAQSRPMLSSVADDSDSLTVDEAPDTPTATDIEPTTPAVRDAPENTTFSEITYNGVTVQASPVQSSDRDDKKYMRYVRYDGDERVVHWGQPGEQMERDNDEARENFNSRHSCSEKKDPFAPGFWACWAWQPDANVRSKSQSPPALPSDWYDVDRIKSELFTWQKMAKNRIKSGTPDEALDFETDVIPPQLQATVRGALKAGVTLNTIEPVFDEALRWCDHA